MIRQEQISEIIDSQTNNFLLKDVGIERTALLSIPQVENFATIITGIRRCGKSTLLLQLLKQNHGQALYFNWEDIRLSGFETEDFIRLYNEIVKCKITVLYFDEIQLVSGWETFVHQLLREGYKVFITGSSASLLSKELGTHLTGRHLSIELFPFSFIEFCRFKQLAQTEDAVDLYLSLGGMPDFLKSSNSLTLQQLVEDILIKDIAVRYGIRDVDALKQLAIYLFTNVGSLVSANKIKELFGIKTATTLLEYFSFLTNSYLIDFIPQFDYSLKVQTRNPKKVYAIDTGIVSEISSAFSKNHGHIFENMVYLHLRRKYRHIYYFRGKSECDFIVKEQEKATLAVQACYELNDDNFKREYNGLLAAMDFLGLREGIIVTKNEKDIFERSGKVIKVIPATEFLAN